MVKAVSGVVADEVPLPTTTGMRRSTPPPASVGSDPSGIAEEVEEIGLPRPLPVSDWSKPEIVDRHG